MYSGSALASQLHVAYFLAASRPFEVDFDVVAAAQFLRAFSCEELVAVKPPITTKSPTLRSLTVFANSAWADATSLLTPVTLSLISPILAEAVVFACCKSDG